MIHEQIRLSLSTSNDVNKTNKYTDLFINKSSNLTKA